MYETNLCKILLPESKSPVLLDYFYLLWLLKTVIKVTQKSNFSRLEVLGGHPIDWLFTHIGISL